MDVSLLEKLSNADALAGCENEVRDIMHKNLKGLCDEVSCDNIGSVIFMKKGSSDGPKIMVAAHMDEVGFKVRTITEEGLIIVKVLGAVKQLAKFHQNVRITTNSGKKVSGVLHSTYTEEEDIKNIPGKTYVDVGADSAQEVEKMGIEIGNIVCFDSQFEKLEKKNLIKGKAFDDRIGCYVLARVLENLKDKKHSNTVYFCGTSSEEVGTRGAQTCTSMINPDIALVVDACCYKDEFDRSAVNVRQLGKGMILTHSDRGLEPNQKLLNLVKKCAKKLNKNLQLDMFDRGSTDGLKIHLNGKGVPTQVCCVPLRYGHCAQSIANVQDIEDAIEIFTELICSIDARVAKDFTTFV